MVTEIVRWCTYHLHRKGEHVRGSQWTLSVAGPDGVVAASVDACEECAAGYVELAAYLREEGEPVSPGAVPAAGSERPDGKRQRKEREPVPPCPVCGEKSPSRAALRMHGDQKHGMSLSDLLGEPAPYRCPECGRGYPAATGAGAHFKARHPDHPMPEWEALRERPEQAAG